MILYIVIFAILQISYNLIFKPKHNTLNCGIFGQATKDPKKINQDKIKILGMFNESRGKSSCGITVDGEVYYGMTGEKLFQDFIQFRDFKAKDFPVIIGHTRQSSVGSVDFHNCHPFTFDYNKINNGYKFIGAHNGTLHNYDVLAKEFDVDRCEEYFDKDGKKVTRYKIDSEILLESIYRSKSFKPLSKYNGRAALVWTDTDNPNVVYLWSGKSKANTYTAEDKAEEERPLCVYIENKNSFYFSSMIESLYAIGGANSTEDNTFQIEYNTVYVVKDGNFKEAEKFKVSRKNCYSNYVNLNTNYNNNNNTYTSKNYAYKTPSEQFDEDEYAEMYGYYPYQNLPQNSNVGKTYNLNNTEDKSKSSVILLPNPKDIIGHKESGTDINIYNLRTLKKVSEYKQRLYPYKLRMWRNGHLATDGIYIFVPNYGFVYFADDLERAELRFNSHKGLKFIYETGRFDIDESSTGSDGIVPFTKNHVIPDFYYFIDGVMIEKRENWQLLYARKAPKLSDNQHYRFDYIELSDFSKHPVIDVSFKTDKPNNSQGIVWKGKAFTGHVSLIGHEWAYAITNGNLVSATIKSINTVLNTQDFTSKREEILRKVEVKKESQNDYFNPEIKQEAENFLKKNELEESAKIHNENTLLEKENEISLAIETEVAKVLDDYVPTVINELSECLAALHPYEKHPAGSLSMQMVEEKIDEFKELLEEKNFNKNE